METMRTIRTKADEERNGKILKVEKEERMRIARRLKGKKKSEGL